MLNSDCYVQGSQLNATMLEMSREMMRAGIIDEMLTETMDSVMDDDGADDETDAEVDKVRSCLLLRIVQNSYTDQGLRPRSTKCAPAFHTLQDRLVV